MLVKYYPLVWDEESKKHSPRSEFLSNGLFRITQPKYLNDKGSEAKLLPYFNEFSPSDLVWAKKQNDKIQSDPSYKPTTEELINFHLRPTGSRYGECFSHMLNEQTGFNSIEEYDKNTFIDSVEIINRILLEALSCHLGILSLCKSDINELMWTHYASEGKGIAITFKENHKFFKDYPPKSVNYKPENRASITYYKGSWRVDGVPIGKFQISDFLQPLAVYEKLLEQGINEQELTKKLMFSKADKWHYEEEARILCPLQICEQKLGSIIEPSNEFNSIVELLNLLQSYSEICLKKIPFDAFDTIVLGYAISDSDRGKIINLIKANPLLTHLKLKIAQHNLYGNLETTELPLE